MNIKNATNSGKREHKEAETKSIIHYAMLEVSHI